MVCEAKFMATIRDIHHLCSFSQRRAELTAPGFSQGVFSLFQSPAGVWVPLSLLDYLAGV